MEMLTSDCETLFADFLAFVESDPSQWMCIHVNMAVLNEDILNSEDLSLRALEGFHHISIKLARKILSYGLDQLEGRIFVFEDGDVLCVYLSDGPSDAIISNLKAELKANGLLSLLHYFTMREKLSNLIALSREKKERAMEYKAHLKALDKIDSILAMTTPDLELRKAIQKKRRQRTTGVILVVEDDLVTRGLITSALKNDYTIVQAKDGKNGLASYMAHSPNLVLLDIHLPSLDGHAVLERILFLDPEAYVVMLSVDSVEQNVLLAQSRGAAGFIKKPFSRGLIIDYIQKCPSLTPEARARALGWSRMTNHLKMD